MTTDKATLRKTKAALAATGIEVNDMELFRMDPHTEPESYIPALEVTAELGAKNIIAQLPAGSRAPPTLREALRSGQAYGVFVSLEFPHWTETGNFRVEIVRAVKRSNAGILVDMLHMDRSNSSVEDSVACRANGSASPTSATRRRNGRTPIPAPFTPRGTNACSPAKAASMSAAFSRRCRKTSPTRWKSRARC